MQKSVDDSNPSYFKHEGVFPSLSRRIVTTFVTFCLPLNLNSPQKVENEEKALDSFFSVFSMSYPVLGFWGGKNQFHRQGMDISVINKVHPVKDTQSAAAHAH